MRLACLSVKILLFPWQGHCLRPAPCAAAGRASLKELAAELGGRAASSLALSERGAIGLASALGADLPDFTTPPKATPAPGAAPGEDIVLAPTVRDCELGAATLCYHDM